MKTFIQRFKVTESHYGRSKSLCQYMLAELSIRKLWLMWCAERKHLNKRRCCLLTFSNIFTTCFNIGFGHPRTDDCTMCQEYDQVIDANNSLSKEAATAKVLHKTRAKQFYRSLWQSAADPSVLCVAFYLQQNMPLPHSNIG